MTLADKWTIALDIEGEWKWVQTHGTHYVLTSNAELASTYSLGEAKQTLPHIKGAAELMPVAHALELSLDQNQPNRFRR